jgi:quercetin dioxygenase-like cupin family protein
MSKYFCTKSDCFTKEIFPGVNIFTAHGRHAMISLVEMKPHSRVEPHEHPHEQLGMLLEGEGDFTIGEETRHVRPGDIWRIPGGVVHSLICGDRPIRAMDVFYPIREDYTHEGAIRRTGESKS